MIWTASTVSQHNSEIAKAVHIFQTDSSLLRPLQNIAHFIHIQIYTVSSFSLLELKIGNL